MMNRIRQALRTENGFIDIFILGMVGMIILLGMGLAVVNFGYQSRVVTATKSLTNALTSRAQEYAGTLNQNLAVPVIPNQGQECSQSPAVCTSITSDVPNGKDSRTVTILASAPAQRLTVTRQMVLTATEATHISSLDSAGNPTWVNSNEGSPYFIWGVAQSSIVGVPVQAQTGPNTPNYWLSATSRAGIDSRGTLWVWGANDACQAGDGSTNTTPAMPEKLDNGGVTFVSVTGDQSDEFALDGLGNAYVWGKNSHGELGLGSTSAVCSPTLLTGHHFIQMAVSNGTAFGIDINNKLWAWGQGSTGQLGNGSATAQQTTPVAIAAASSFSAVATSGATTYAIDKSLKLWSWGANNAGQLGKGNTTATSTAAAVGLGTQFDHVTAGNQTGYALDTSGNLWSWGANGSGQLGDGTYTNRGTPTHVAAGSVFVDVSGGNNRAFAINNAGQLESWGDNTAGALGNGNTGAVLTPATILPYNFFNSVVAGPDTNITVTRDTTHALWAVGATPGNHGVWQSDETTSTGIPLRMPAPAGFGSPTWN